MPQTYLPIKNNVLLTGVGTSSVTDITAATVVKAVPGRIARVVVLVAGSAAGSVNNCITTGAAAISNAVFIIPATLGVYFIDMPCSVGVTVVPGTGQTLAVSYS